MTSRTREHVRAELEKAELCIKRRSIAVENKWSTDKLKLASVGIMQTKILAVLDALDKHCGGQELTDANGRGEKQNSSVNNNNNNACGYELADVNVHVDKLYANIFAPLPSASQISKLNWVRFQIAEFV